MHGGHEGDAQIVVAPVDLHAHASVLRKAALGDVEAAHDLHAGHQGDLEILGRRRAIHEHTVNAVTEAHHFVEWLDVHVARSVFDGLEDNKIGQLDDGRLLGGSVELVNVYFLDDFLDGFETIGVFGGLLFGILDDVLHRARFGTLDLMKFFGNGALGSNQRNDLKLGDAPDVVDSEDVERVGHRENEAVFQEL